MALPAHGGAPRRVTRRDSGTMLPVGHFDSSLSKKQHEELDTFTWKASGGTWRGNVPRSQPEYVREELKTTEGS